MVSKTGKPDQSSTFLYRSRGRRDLHCAGGGHRLGTVLKEAKEAKIPVFLLDRSIDVKDKDLYMTTVTANNVLEGQLIGDWLVKTVDGKPCNVVELQGTVGPAWPSIVKGFADAIAKAANIKIIRSQSGDFTRSKGKRSWRALSKLRITAKHLHGVRS